MGYVFFIITVAIICWVMKQLVDIRLEVETISKKLDSILSTEKVLTDSNRKDS
jgi:hypothetical protein